MYEAFFEMTNTPFVKNIPVSSLYIPPFIEEAQGRLTYGVDNNLFIVESDAGERQFRTRRYGNFIISIKRSDNSVTVTIHDSHTDHRKAVIG